MDAHQRVRALQHSVRNARTIWQRGDRTGALREIDAALAIDPGFLAARALRDAILKSPLPPVVRVEPALAVDPSPSIIEEPDVDLLTHDFASWDTYRTDYPVSERRSHSAVATLVVVAAIACAAFVGGVWWSRTAAPPPQAAVAVSGVQPEPIQGEAKKHEEPATPEPAAQQPPPASQEPAGQQLATTGSRTIDAPVKAPVVRQPAISNELVPADTLVRQSVERFRASYNARAATHRERESAADVLNFERCEVSIEGDAGHAACPRTSDQSVWTFTLVQSNGEWAIKSIAMR